jgi:GNAT superfamily N-acetyltransferase
MRVATLGRVVRECDGREGLPRGFLELPPLVYEGDALWIPEDARDVERAFSPANPWFTSGAARSICIPNRSRLAVFRHPAMHVAGEATAFFGYWESAGDAEADALTMRKAEAWARQRGARLLLGPINFSTFGSYRVRLSAEPGGVPFPGEPYNPPDYPAMLERLGFTVRERYLTQVGPFPRERCTESRATYEALRAEGYTFQCLTPALWLSRLGELHTLIDLTFRGNLAYTPVDDITFSRSFGSAFIGRACSNSSTLALAPNGAIAGFFLVCPHYGPLLVQGTGCERVTVGSLDYARHAPMLAERGPMHAIVKTVGVHPHHQRKGVMNALAVAMCERGALERYTTWYGALIRQDNVSRRFAEGHTAAERWYALYGKHLGGAQVPGL